MRPKQYSILHDKTKKVYVSQYSYDGKSWYSFLDSNHHEATIVFNSLAHAKRFLKEKK